MASTYEVRENEEQLGGRDAAVYRDPGAAYRSRESASRLQLSSEVSPAESQFSWWARTLRDTRISRKLAVGFGILMLLLIAIAATGIVNTKKISTEMLTLLNQDAAALEIYNDALIKALEMRRDERDLFLNREDAHAYQAAKEDWKAMDQKLSDDLDSAGKLASTQEEKDDIASMRAALKDYEQSYLAMQAKIDSGKAKTRKEWQEADKDAAGAREFIEEHARSQGAEHSSRMGDRRQATETLVGKSIWVILGVVFFGLIAGTAISVVTTRSITQPVHEAVSATDSILRGERNVQVDTSRGDEMGQLMTSVKKVSDEFQTRMDAMSRIQSMIENAPVNVMCTDMDLRLVYMNKASKDTLRKIESVLPVKVDDMIGKPIDIFHKNPEHQRKMLATDKYLPHEALIEVGMEKMQLRVSAVYDDSGRYIGPMVTWELVTQRLKDEEARKKAQEEVKETAENTRALNRVLEAMTRAKNMEEAARAALDTVKDAFGWAYGSYWILDAKDNALKFAVESGSVNEEFRRVTLEARFREGEGLSGRAWRNRDLFFVPDLGELKDCVRAPVARHAGVKSGIAFPILLDGQVAGTMDFFSLETLAPSADRLETLKNVGKMVSSAFARISSNEREQREQRELREKVTTILKVVQAAAKGDLTQEISVKGEDAVGQMGQGLDSFFSSLRGSIAGIAHNAESLASASEELSAVSQQMSVAAEETSSQANVVTAAAEEVDKNLQTVATGTEEMSVSIKEIAKNATEAAKIANSAVGVADRTNQTVTKLGESSAEIGEVVKVITSIAQQTNLLALNATIEAARAGEAGKGFAVVANEVKELAKETAKATEDISRKIETIQTDTKEAVEAIGSISAIINQVNNISSTIASAVEEQNATTNEMSRNVTDAARGSGEISKNIAGVAEAAQSATHGASDSQKAAQQLSKMANELKELTAKFRY